MVIRPCTALELLTALDRAGCVPTVNSNAITFAAPYPPELARPLATLHVGVRALLVGREWIGCSRETGWAQPIDPAERIPFWVGMHCVEGDDHWQIVQRKTAEFWDVVKEPKRIANPHKYAPRTMRAAA